MTSDESDMEIDGTPPELRAEAQLALNNLLPAKSKERYITCYESFLKWRADKNAHSFSETVFLAYFTEMAQSKKPSSLWAMYSMMKATMQLKHNIDMQSFSNLRAWLKRNSAGYKAKKARIFSSENIETFLNCAPDDTYLAIKTMDYEEVPNKSGDEKSVWHNFLRARDKKTAKCKICRRILKCDGGSTGGLQKHLRNLHSINTSVQAQSKDPSTPSTSSGRCLLTEEVPNKKTKLTDYYDSEVNPSMEVMVSRMAAMDGQPFRVFVESDDMRLLFKKAGHILPKSANTIRNIIISEANKRKVMLIADIQRLMKEGHKFSITFDEWTSIRNRRYISLNLHSQHFPLHFKNLGLIRIYGSMP